MNDVSGGGGRSEERPPLIAPPDAAGRTLGSANLDPLITRLKAGRADAYNRLYGLMADRLFRSAYRLLQDRQEAEDAVQQAFLELIRAKCPPDEGRSLEAWLHRSVRFTCLDTIRQRNRRPSTAMASVPERHSEDDHWLGFDADLEMAMAQLTDEQRLVVYLKHVEGLDGHEIGEIVGTNRMAVYARASRAERRLGKLLKAMPSHVEGQRPRPQRFRGSDG